MGPVTCAATVGEPPEYIESMVDEAKDLSDVERESLRNLLLEFHDVFCSPGEKLGRTHLFQHRIWTTTDRPVKQLPYRNSYAKRQVRTGLDARLTQRASSTLLFVLWCHG